MTGPPAGRTVPGNRWDLLDGCWPDEAPTVTVVVVHYRQQAALDRTLAALARQDHPRERLEAIVVDDGSPEAPRVPAGVRLLVQPDAGFRAAAARNLGAAHAGGELLCFLDADTTPEPEYVRRLTRLPAIAPEAVTLGRRRHARLAEVPAGTPVELAGPRCELPSPAWLADAYRRTCDLLDADARSYRFVLSAVIACGRWFFSELGGFDERFVGYGGEDWEWAHRAWTAGAILAHVPTAVAWHDGPDWAGRAAGQAAKNRETLRLADVIPVPGARGHALRGRRPSVVVRLQNAESVASAFVCVDELFAAVPEAVVELPEAIRAALPADGRLLAPGTVPPALPRWRSNSSGRSASTGPRSAA